MVLLNFKELHRLELVTLVEPHIYGKQADRVIKTLSYLRSHSIEVDGFFWRYLVALGGSKDQG